MDLDGLLADTDALLADIGAPTDAPRDLLDARDLPPPEPLQRTLERLADLEEGTVLVQFNDRAPQHLYPRLRERGYAFETVVAQGPPGRTDGGDGAASADDVTVTVIWSA